MDGTEIFDGDKWRDAITVITKWLEQEPCKDVVSRKAVINTLNNMDKALDTERTVEKYKLLLTECYEVLPSVQPKVKTGHWKTVPHEETLYCSECNLRLDDEQTYIPLHYCPNCGCRMVKPRESEG